VAGTEGGEEAEVITPARRKTDSRKRVVIPLRRVSGSRAIVFVERLAAGTYRAGWYTSAPGWTAYGRQAAPDVGYPTEQAAVDAACLEMRGYWEKLGVPAMVADLGEWFEAWEEVA